MTKGEFQDIPDRKISINTCKFYGVTVRGDKHIYPYHDDSGSLVANKVRQTSTKSFYVEGNLPSAKLFGQNKFASRGKFVTVCEGEIDAMSAYEMLGSKWPVLSIKNGAQSALKDEKANYEYLNGFEKIVLCFDNDEHGKKAANQVAQVFEPSKCLIMNMAKKDANEYLKENKREEFTRAWWDAKPYTPAGIINLFYNIFLGFLLTKNNIHTNKFGILEKIVPVMNGFPRDNCIFHTPGNNHVVEKLECVAGNPGFFFNKVKILGK